MGHLGRAAPTLGRTATSKVTRMPSGILGFSATGARAPSPQAPAAEGQRSRCAARWVALAAHAPRSRRLREGRPASRRARGFGGAGAAWEAGCGPKGRLAWVTAPQLALGMGRQCQAVNVLSGRWSLPRQPAHAAAASGPPGCGRVLRGPRKAPWLLGGGSSLFGPALSQPAAPERPGGQVRERSVRPARPLCRSP